MPQISTAFDGGNIKVLDQSDPGKIRLEIQKDGQADFYQWFYFRVSEIGGAPLRLVIENAGGSSYPKGWSDYRAVASTDRKTWIRVETGFDGKALTIDHAPDGDVCWYAYFAPYTLEQHEDLIGRASASPLAKVERLGATLDGRDLDMITFGSGPKPLWIIARQHPGESMTGWFMEGVVDRLLDPQDPIARGIAKGATLHLVPNMNPDGV